MAKKFSGRQILVAAIFFGMSTANVQAADFDTQTDPIVEEAAQIQFEDLLKFFYVKDIDDKLAALQDIIKNFDAQKFSVQTLDGVGNHFINASPFVGVQPSAVALNVRGSNNVAIQHGDIFLTGADAVGIHIGGTENFVTVNKGALIISSGLGGKGILIDGGGHVLNVNGKIFAAGNAIEFIGDNEAANVLNIAGNLRGDEHAIFIGEGAFVQSINVNAGSQIVGDIASNSLRTTDLNFNAANSYGGNISGNINLHVNGTMNFTGAAEILSVDVGKGAQLFGGTFTTKKFVNHGTIGASSPDSNLIVNGDFISDGFLKKISGSSQGLIVVNGKANVDGSTVTTDSLLPNETATVLVADEISGKIKNPIGNPVPISAMLNAAGKIVGNTLTVTTYEANNLGKMTSQEKKTFDAMNTMFETLDDAKQNEMRDLYNLPAQEAKQTLTQISSNDSAQIMSVAQQNTAVDKMIAGRIMQVFAPNYVDVNVRPLKFAANSDDASDVIVNVKVPTQQENNFWLNFMKNWGSLRGGTDYHGSAIVGGWDRSIGDKWRAGIFATYGTIGYGANSSRATVYDTRLGLYAGYHNRASDIYFYVNGGQLRNSLHRGLSSLGLTTNANYKSRIVEFGGEYKYDLQPKRTWHVSPFVNVQASHIRQNSYNERGAGIYNQHVDASGNTYFAAQFGLDLKRWYRSGTFGLRFGVKHGFTGADPDLHISYEGDGGRSYRLRQRRDKTHFVFSVRGDNEFARGWFAGGEAELQLGEHDHDVTASFMLRRTW